MPKSTVILGVFLIFTKNSILMILNGDWKVTEIGQFYPESRIVHLVFCPLLPPVKFADFPVEIEKCIKWANFAQKVGLCLLLHRIRKALLVYVSQLAENFRKNPFWCWLILESSGMELAHEKRIIFMEKKVDCRLCDLCERLNPPLELCTRCFFSQFWPKASFTIVDWKVANVRQCWPYHKTIYVAFCPILNNTTFHRFRVKTENH